MKNALLISILLLGINSLAYAGGDDRDQQLPLNSLNTEQINDSTKVEYLHINDANQSGKVLKYEAWSGFPIDTITVSGNVLEVAFY